jgi:hypothetical protein
MSRLPQEVIDRLAELQELDDLRDKFLAAISQANSGNTLGWHYPPDLIVPVDIERSYLAGPPH